MCVGLVVIYQESKRTCMHTRTHTHTDPPPPTHTHTDPHTQTHTHNYVSTSCMWVHKIHFTYCVKNCESAFFNCLLTSLVKPGKWTPMDQHCNQNSSAFVPVPSGDEELDLVARAHLEARRQRSYLLRLFPPPALEEGGRGTQSPALHVGRQ